MEGKLKNGVAGATILSASFGCFILGVAVVLSSACVQVKNILTWWNPAGPLTGKTSLAVIAWLISWCILLLVWGKKDINLKLVVIISFLLLLLGFLGTFPPFYEMFEYK